MELLETQNPERKKLLETSERHKRELEKEVRGVSDKTEKTLKNALIIGGALAVTYLLVSQMGSGKKKKKAAKIQFQAAPSAPIQQEEGEETPSAFASIGAKIADAATVMLLDMAKEALTEFLKTRKQDADS